jgi:hypothetical protein
MDPAQIAVGRTSRRHIPVVIDVARAIVKTGVCPNNEPHEPSQRSFEVWNWQIDGTHDRGGAGDVCAWANSDEENSMPNKMRVIIEVLYMFALITK